MKAKLKIIRDMDRELINILMEILILDNGLKIVNKEKELLPFHRKGKVVVMCIKASLIKANLQDMDIMFIRNSLNNISV